eukprot:gene31916-42577_t
METENQQCHEFVAILAPPLQSAPDPNLERILLALKKSDERVIEALKKSDEQLQGLYNAFSVLVPTVMEQSFKQRRYVESKTSASEHKTERGDHFREDLLRHLGYCLNNSSSNRNAAVVLTCMASGEASSGMDNIRAAHIIPAKSDHLDIAKLNLTEKDIDSVRNGLLLSKNIERAFYAYEISFVKQPLTQLLTMQFWNPHSAWKAKTLFASSSRTIGEFEGRVLDLKFKDRDGSHVPFLRGLAYQ